jgi:hypothetical protein
MPWPVTRGGFGLQETNEWNGLWPLLSARCCFSNPRWRPAATSLELCGRELDQAELEVQYKEELAKAAGAP